MRRITILQRLSIYGLSTVAVALAVSAAPVLAIESFGVGAIPANPRADNPRTKSIFVYQLEPSSSVSDGVKVINNSDTTRTLAIYPVDSQASSDGAFACAQAADTPKGVGSWIKLSKDRVTLEPKTNEVVDFSLQVPAIADVGEHNGCIAIQDVSSGAQSNQNGIALSFRSALRVAVTIPGKLVTKLQFIDVQTKPVVPDKLRVTPIVQNLGNVSLDTDFQVKLVDVLGATIVKGGGEFPVLRDTKGQFNFELDTPFWGGWYQRVTDVHYAALAQSGIAPQTSQLATQSSWLFVAPHPVAAIIEAAIVGLVLIAIAATIWRRQQHAQLKRQSILYEVHRGDNIQMIAKTHHVRWQTLAKLNKLKPPYALSEGITIKVPKQPKKTKTFRINLKPKR